MKDHDPSCPLSQAWDHGEWEARCTCSKDPRANLRAKIQQSIVKVCGLDPKVDFDAALRITDQDFEDYEEEILRRCTHAAYEVKALYGLRCDKEAIEARKALDAVIQRMKEKP